jgi:uncharacterized protein
MASFTSPAYRAAAVGVAAGGLLVGAFSLGAGTHGTGSPAAAATFTSATSTAGRITVAGTGTVTGVPNQLSLSLTVQANGASVGSALTQASQTVRGVTATLRSHGVPNADIQTSDVNISPNYTGNNEITGYGASESLTVTLNNLATAGAQINAAVRAGGNAVSVDGVSLNLTDTGRLMAAARARAVADARAKASQYAQAIGAQLGPVLSISEVQQQAPYPMFAGSVAAGTRAAVPISPGRQQLSVSVTVVYAT